MTSDLLTKHCAPCEGGTQPMTAEEAQRYLAEAPGWRLVEGDPLKIERGFKFKDFAGAIAFVNQVAALAESEGHHPDICVSWNQVTLTLTTHAIRGLSENDFIMAAKISEIEARNKRMKSEVRMDDP